MYMYSIMRKPRLYFDLQITLLDKVENVTDFINICLSNKELYNYCKKHKKDLFKELVKKKTFRTDFFTKLNIYLERTKWNKILQMLKWYPVGEIYNERNNELYASFNSLQLELVELIRAQKDHTEVSSLLDQNILKDLFILLFFPTNYIVLSILHVEKLYFHYQVKKSKFHKYIIPLFMFHLEMRQKMYKKSNQYMFHNVMNTLIEEIIMTITEFDIDAETYYFYEQLLREFDRFYEHFKELLFLVIYKELDISEPIDSIEVQDLFADHYDYIRRIYILFNLEETRQYYIAHPLTSDNESNNETEYETDIDSF